MARARKTVLALAVVALLATLAYMALKPRRRREGMVQLAPFIMNLIGMMTPKPGYSKKINTGGSVTVYEHTNFSGASTSEFDVPNVKHDLRTKGWNNRVSAIKIPLGRSVRMYIDGKGKNVGYIDLPPGWWDMFQLGLNDKMTALQVYWTFKPPPPLGGWTNEKVFPGKK